jgi:hypothetical protein
MGAATSVPDVLDEAQAKELSGDRWSQEVFNANKDGDGKITKAQFEEQRAMTDKAVAFCEEQKGNLPQNRNLVDASQIQTVQDIADKIISLELSIGTVSG